MSNMITLLCGYAGSGKDTLYKTMNSGSEYLWMVYSRENKNFSLDMGERRSFAENVKKEVRTMLSLSTDPEDKNQIMPSGKSFREHCIEVGCMKRKNDPDYWCKTTCFPFAEEDNYTITDWRFPNELEYILSNSSVKVRNCRIYRKDVAIAPLRENLELESEHCLDKLVTDYLIVPAENHKEEFESACAIFPQYSDFIPLHEIGNKTSN